MSAVVFLFLSYAEAARPENKISSEHFVVTRLNPLGLAYFGEISFERRLYRAEHPAFQDNFVSLGVLPTLSPALARIGAAAEVQPLSVLNLSARYEYLGFFGNFDVLQSFPRVNSDYRDSTLQRRASEPGTRNYPTTGHQVTLATILQAKVGPIAARSHVKFIYTDMALRRGERLFYDAVNDILSPNKGWVFSNDLDVVWMSDFGLSGGLRWSTADAFYESRHYAPDEPQGSNPNGPIHRIGPVLTYTLFDDPNPTAFDKPTFVLILNWYASHRYRTGEHVDIAVPYVVFGFTWTGDLLAI